MVDQYKQRRVLCLIVLVRDHSGHLVNQHSTTDILTGFSIVSGAEENKSLSVKSSSASVAFYTMTPSVGAQRKVHCKAWITATSQSYDQNHFIVTANVCVVPVRSFLVGERERWWGRFTNERTTERLAMLMPAVLHCRCDYNLDGGKERSAFFSRQRLRRLIRIYSRVRM